MIETRPVFLNLLKIRLPITGVVSIAHRISGVLLFLAIPFAVYLLDLSASSAGGFEQSLRLLQHPLSQLLLILIVWAFSHHLLAGIRYLLLDLDIGVDKAGSRLSSWAVLVAELGIVAAFAWSVLL